MKIPDIHIGEPEPEGPNPGKGPGRGGGGGRERPPAGPAVPGPGDPQGSTGRYRAPIEGGTTEGQARQQQKAWMRAHPKRALANIARGQLGYFDPSHSPPAGAVARITAHLQAQVDRHAAVVARRQARNTSRGHVAP